jgi:dihydrofolate synthase/folylpolyglutamate synthase
LFSRPAGNGYEHPIVTYAQAIEFLSRLQMFGARPGLETTRRLSARAGHPGRGLRFVHVAGTNGKGSTCALLETIYRAAGFRTGLYTSPHLVSFRERIQLGRRMIPEADVARLVGEMQPWLAEFSAATHPTFFEFVTVLALRWFAEQGCDVVIWETGLGGRLDATNIVVPLATVITNVQLDHETWLGGTVGQIAGEKAGIIKPRVPVVTGSEDPDAVAVIRARALEAGAPLAIVSADDTAHVPATLALAGEHQRHNAALALKVVELLQGELPVSPGAALRGCEQTAWPGRFQIVQRGAQTLVLDGAHNPAGAQVLARTLRARFPDRAPTLVLGVLADKDWTALCHILAPLARRIIVSPVGSPRTAEPARLAAACRVANPRIEIVTAGGCAHALQLAEPDPLAVISGSLYFIGEALERLGLGPAASERTLNEWTQPR